MTTDIGSPDVRDAGGLPAADGLLGALVQMMNARPGSSIGVTLHVSGVIVTGQIIAISDYFAELGAEIAAAGGPPGSGAGRAAFAEAFTELAADARPAADAALDDLAPAAFIHLRNARVISDTARSGFLPALWRGRLEHVSAWSLGELSAQ